MENFKVRLKRCVEDIKLDSSINEKILNLEETNYKEREKYNRKIYNRIVLKYATCFLILIALTVTISSGAVYCFSGKTILELFFDNKGADYTAQLLDTNGQSVQIDDYTVTLQQTLYDCEAGIGYLVFMISKKDGKPEIQLNKYGDAISQGFGGERFKIDLQASGARTEKYEFEGNKLYEYITFNADKEYDLSVDLIDYSQKSTDNIYGYKCYKFHIAKTTLTKKYKISDSMQILMSPVGMAIDCNNELKNIRIETKCKNGQKEELINANEMEEFNCIQKDNNIRYQYVFPELVNVSDIKYIIYDNKEYKEYKEME